MPGKYKINPHTNNLDRVKSTAELQALLSVFSRLKEPVSTYSNLPVSSNVEGDLRVTLDTDKLYVWGISATSGVLADWILIGSVPSFSWGGIIGTLSDQTDLQNALDGKADSSHTHAISDITDLQSDLDDKADKTPSLAIGDAIALIDTVTGNLKSSTVDITDAVKSIQSNKGVELDADPSDPADGEYVIWMSTGTDSGNAGDIMIKITESAVTTTYKLLDVQGATPPIIAENTDIDVGTEVVDSFSDLLADSCNWEYRVTDGTNFRSGTIIAVWNASTNTVEYTETTTSDIGDTSDLTLDVIINSDNVELQATLASGSNYQVKAKRQLI